MGGMAKFDRSCWLRSLDRAHSSGLPLHFRPRLRRMFGLQVFDECRRRVMEGLQRALHAIDFQQSMAPLLVRLAMSLCRSRWQKLPKFFSLVQ